MATSTMQATNGGNISWKPVMACSHASLGRRARRAEGAAKVPDPEGDEVEVGGDAGGATDVGGNDHRLRSGASGDLLHLVARVVVRREQDGDVPVPHLVDHLQHVSRRGRNAGRGLEESDA